MTLDAWRQAAVVLRKEVTDSFRDRRALMSIVFGVMLGPVMVVFMINRVAEREREAEDVRIPVVGSEHAPALVDWLRQQPGIEIVSGPEDPEAAVRDQNEEIVVVISTEFAERFRESRPATVRVIADNSRNVSRPTVERVRRLLQAYNSQIGSLRLIARGVSPAAVTPLQVEEIDVSSAQQRGGQVLAFIPMFIILAAFTGGMAIATDSTAGERERGSLEPLLVNPVPRGALVTGKWLAAAFAASLTVGLTTLLSVAMPRFLPLEDMGIRFRLGPEQVGGILAAVLPMCLFITALQACIATLARSFKEAQSYMGLLIIVPMVPGIMAALYPIGNQVWMYSVPVLGTQVLLTNVLGGRPPAPGAFVTVALISVLVAILLVRVTTQLFRSERIIFGR
jgi:sodium transport system permease protein